MDVVRSAARSATSALIALAQRCCAGDTDGDGAGVVPGRLRWTWAMLASAVHRLLLSLVRVGPGLELAGDGGGPRSMPSCSARPMRRSLGDRLARRVPVPRAAGCTPCDEAAPPEGTAGQSGASAVWPDGLAGGSGREGVGAAPAGATEDVGERGVVELPSPGFGPSGAPHVAGRGPGSVLNRFRDQVMIIPFVRSGCREWAGRHAGRRIRGTQHRPAR